MVVQIMELAKGFKDDFEKQFNKTPQIASRQSKAANDSGTTVASKSTEVSTFETAPSEAKEQAQASPPPVSKEFDLGI
jgi:hypothetical protein